MENELLSQYWWEKTEKVHEHLFGIVRFLDQNQSYRQQGNLRAMRLYGNMNVLGLSANTYSQSTIVSSHVDKITLNVVQSCCDTVTQKIAKNKPKPTFLVEGGNFSMKKKAKQLEKFVLGQFYNTKLYETAPRVFLDAAVFGTGFLKIYREQDEICAERVFPDEIMVDDSDAFYGTPRSLYQRKYVQKELLAKMYPKKAHEIMACKRADVQLPYHHSLSSLVMVLESWHLPVKQGEKSIGGRHVIAIENATLFDGEWEKDYFPFATIRWNPRILGYFGQGLADQLMGIQVEINKLLRTVQLSYHLMGVPKYLVEVGSKIVKAHLNNEVGGIVTYSGMKPEVYTPPAVNPQLIEHLYSLYSRAYEIAGISQLSAQSKKPAGLNSGKALREFNDIESERFILTGQAYENFFCEAAKQFIELGKEIYGEDKEYAVTARSKSFIEKIKWADVDMKADEYVMQVFPTSMLSNTPAGRLADIQEYMQAGMIDRVAGMRLLDVPDLEGHVALATAGIQDIEDTIERILDRGEYSPPEPFQDLERGISMMQSAYLEARTDNALEENLELLRRWMSEANAMKATATQAAMPAQAQPLAAPQAPPQSEMLPNAPQ